MPAIQKYFTEEDRLAAIRRDKKAWLARNPEKRKAASLKYDSSHRKEKSNQERSRYWANVELSRKRGRERTQTHREKYPERASISSIRWQKKNRHKINARKRERKKIDPAFKALENTRSRIRTVLKCFKKSKATLRLVGCSLMELRGHLEKQFRPGMTWENYGPVWHVDHIKPCAKFDLSEAAQQQECFHFSNLQPLFALENLKKKDKYGDSAS